MPLGSAASTGCSPDDRNSLSLSDILQAVRCARWGVLSVAAAARPWVSSFSVACFSRTEKGSDNAMNVVLGSLNGI